jgi:hypothetical protein
MKLLAIAYAYFWPAAFSSCYSLFIVVARISLRDDLDMAASLYPSPWQQRSTKNPEVSNCANNVGVSFVHLSEQQRVNSSIKIYAVYNVFAVSLLPENCVYMYNAIVRVREKHAV